MLRLTTLTFSRILMIYVIPLSYSQKSFHLMEPWLSTLTLTTMNISIRILTVKLSLSVQTLQSLCTVPLTLSMTNMDVVHILFLLIIRLRELSSFLFLVCIMYTIRFQLSQPVLSLVYLWKISVKDLRTLPVRTAVSRRRVYLTE